MDVFEKSVPYLVIDGFISNKPGEQFIRIYHSASYNKPLKLQDVIGADVRLVDDLGNEQPLTYRDIGYFYTPENFAPVTGRSYQLQVTLVSGRSYQSSWELMRAVPPIEAARYEVREDQVFFMVDFTDPAEIENYYRWRFRGTYSKLAESSGMICYAPDFDHEFLKVASDFLFRGREMVNFNILSKKPGTKFNRGYYIEIQQFAISKEAYTYLLAIQTQKENTGSIFDTNNYQIRGNLSSTTNTSELVLGYFGIAAVSMRSLAIDDFINRFPPEPCEATGPQGLPLRCYDCSEGVATTEKPDYWPFSTNL